MSDISQDMYCIVARITQPVDLCVYSLRTEEVDQKLQG